MIEPKEPSSEVVEAVRFIINSRAWIDFYAPSLETARDRLVAQLLDPSAAREAREPDDYLRGRIHTLDTVLKIGKIVVDDHDSRKHREDQLRRYPENLQERADVGHAGPLG